MAQHTPGPWRWQSFGVIVDRDGRPVCRLADHGRIEANAHLIAAAPDLLAALKDMLAASATRNDYDQDWIAACIAARAAVAKAEKG